MASQAKECGFKSSFANLEFFFKFAMRLVKLSFVKLFYEVGTRKLKNKGVKSVKLRRYQFMA